MKKLVLAAIFLVLCGLFATAAWANSTQVTLSLSTTGDVFFGNSGGTISAWFSGTCGLLSDCISGTALLEPQGTLGQYQMWFAGGSPTLSGGPLDYTVNMGSSTLYLAVQLNGSQGSVLASVDLADVYGGASQFPEFAGTFTVSTATLLFLTDHFVPHGSGVIDFTINLTPNPPIASLTNGQQTFGPLSSGEGVPNVPEPSSLALLGSGVLGLAGVIRRKMKA